MQHKFNPFRPGSAVTPGMFSGRINELDSMERALFQTKNGNPNHFLIEGERGIGKTSLFLYLDWVGRGTLESRKHKFNFIVVNIELRDNMSQEDILNDILVNLRRDIAAKEQLKHLCKSAWDFLSRFEVMGVKYNSNQSDESAGVKFDELTDALADIITNGKTATDGVLLLIDEAEKPSSSAKLGGICKLLTERLTRRGCDRVCLGLAGLPGLVTKIKEGHESAARIFTIMPLEPLEPHERIRVVKRGLELAEEANLFKTEINNDACEMLANLSEGYPHFLQEFCFHAFETDTDNLISVDDVLRGAFCENGAIDQLGQKYYADMYIDQIGSEDYRKVLACMAEKLDEWVPRQYLIEQSGVKDRIIDNALAALKERGMIIVNPRERGQYRLPTKSFAIWIKVKESARKKEQEAKEIVQMEPIK